MRRLLLALAFVLISSPAWACQYGVTGGTIAGIAPLNYQSLSGSATAVPFTLPTTTGKGKTVKGVMRAMVTVTSGAVNYLDNGVTPTTSTTAGGQPAGNCTGCSIYFEICGQTNVSNFLAIGQGGAAFTLSISYDGSAQ